MSINIRMRPTSIGISAILMVASLAGWSSIVPGELSVPPKVTINQASGQPDPTNKLPIRFTVAFTKDVKDFTSGDVNIGGTAPGTGTSIVTGSGRNYDVEVRGITGSGTVTATVNAGVAHDAVGNENKVSTSTDNVVTYDITPPAVTINQAIGQPDPTRNTPILFDVVFSKTVNDFASGDVSLNGTAPGVLTTTVTGSGMHYTVAIAGMTGSGTVVASIAAGVVHDYLGNEGTASTSYDNIVTYDVTPPTISIGAPSVSLTRSGPVTYTIKYVGADAVTLTAEDVNLNPTGSAYGMVSVTGTGTNTRIVTISGIAGDGTLGISIASNTASDIAGNNASAAGPSATFVVDNTAPTISIGAPSALLTRSGPVSYEVAYTGANSVMLNTDDITLNRTGTANGTMVVSGVGSDIRVVTISGITGNGTLGISIAANTASDTAGNNAPAAGPSATFVVDNTAPTISIGAPSATLTTNGPVTYAITYSGADAVTLAAANVTLDQTGTANGNVAVSGTGNTTRVVTISGITGNGTLGISVAANTASDTAGNNAPAAGPSATFVVDNTSPTISIGVPSATLTKSGSVSYTVSYSGADTVTLAAANVTLNKTGTANGSIAVSGTGNTTRVVTFSGITGTGTLGISIAANTASDTAGNNAPAAGPSTTFVVDNTAPTISIGAPSATLTKSGPVSYTVSYSGADTVTLAAANVTLNKTGTANGSIAVSGTGNTARVVTISGITGNGTLGISVAANTASETAGNNAPAAGPSATFVVNNTFPTISIGAPSASLTKGGPVSYTVTYGNADSVTLAVASITLNKTGSANGVMAVTGSGTTTRTVTITSVTGDGTLGISIAANTASDTSGNNAPAAGPSATFVVDNTAPTISIGAPSATLTTNGPVTYAITYSGADAVTLAAANVTLNQTGTANGTVAVTGSGLSSRTVTISGITGNGTLGISIAANTASDTAGNNAPAAGPSATFVVDNTAPTISIGAPSATLTTNGPVTYAITYSGADAVTLAAANVTLNQTGTANGNVAVSGTGNTTRVVTISGITGNGTLGISITANTASDTAGNNAPAAGPSATFVVDNTAPTVTIDQASTQLDPTNAVPIHFTVVFSEVVTDFAASDVTTAGTAPGSLTKVVTGSGTTYDVAVTGMSGSGTVIASLLAGVAHDAASNGSIASTSTDNTVMYDVTAPTVTVNQAAIQSDPTNTIPIHFTVVFSEVVTDFAASDVTTSGTAPGTLTKVLTGSGTTYDIAVSGMSGSGTVIASLLAGVAHDAVGNASMASTSTDNTVTFQKVLTAAAGFASFGGGAGMTNQGTNTIINGDIGTTGASTTMTGFHDSTGDGYTETPLNIGTVLGRIYTAAPPPVIFLPGGPYGGTAETKAIADAAALDALTAFNYLAGLPTTGPDPSASGDLGGITVPPGVYKSAGGSFAILPGETLTLDAQGNDNARWVFQMGSSLTVGAIGAGATPSKVVFKDGIGQAENVYWQVGSAATINTGAEMIGTIIASAGVTFSTAGEVILTTLQGRALSLNASCTLVNTHINVPNASPVHSLSGQVQLSDFIGDVPDQQLVATVNSSANPSIKQNVSLQAQTDGQFTMTSNLVPPYDVRMASPHFLTTSTAKVVPSQSLVFRLVNGDANGDGVVNLFDYVALDSHYGSNDAMADLDGDGSVNLFDYVIVDQNFGATGK